MQTVEQWLSGTAEKLKLAQIPSARLDAELLLSHMLGVDRAWLIARGDESLARAALMNPKGVRPGGISIYGDKLLLRRLKREPIAYIVGHKEFYGRDFIITKDVLVLRPETEVLIELAKKHGLSGQMLDVGTGSGCAGLTLALETSSQLTASDISEPALAVARQNAKRLGVTEARFVTSDLLEYWLSQKNSEPFDTIVANLPYVDRSWERSPETKFEPGEALFAGDGGLALIKRLIDQASRLQKPGSHLLLEAHPGQMNDIALFAAKRFKQTDRLGFGLLLQKL